MIFLTSMNGAANRDYILHALRASGAMPRRRRRVPRPLFPRRAERSYLRELLAIIDRWDEAAQALIVAELPQIVSEYRLNQPAIDSEQSSEHLDAWGERVFRLIQAIRDTMLGLISDSALVDMLEKVGDQVNRLNDEQHKKILRTVLGVDVFASDPWLRDEMEAFVLRNVSMIKGLQEEYLAEVQAIIHNGVRQGLRHEVIAQELRSRPHLKLEKRAAFIARNQVAQFNSTMDRIRMQRTGFRAYIWRGVLDERERPEHVAREGRRYTWDKPPAGGDHPGHEYNCRCTAAHDFDLFFEDLDKKEAA